MSGLIAPRDMLSLINSESADPQKRGRGTEGGVMYECAGGGNRRRQEKQGIKRESSVCSYTVAGRGY